CRSRFVRPDLWTPPPGTILAQDALKLSPRRTWRPRGRRFVPPLL
ncbi:MAG: hypothetical protein AVDCRST_MAG08-1610, partial [uncultured Acetobacteraceae bacterium]